MAWTQVAGNANDASGKNEAMSILVLNAGSSNLKFSLFDDATQAIVQPSGPDRGCGITLASV